MPQPVNPQITAGAQTQSNIETALANARLGAVNKITPYGDVTYQFGTPPPKPAATNTGAGAGGAGGAGGTAAAAPGLAWENHIRSQLGMPALQPGTPEYNQWLQNSQRQAYGGPGAAAGGGGMGGIGGGGSGGAFAGGGGAGDPGAGSHGGQPTM